MKKYLEMLRKLPLFFGIEEADLESLIKCLGGIIKKYEKDDVIMLSGEKVDRVGILLSGRVLVIKEDFSGNRSIHAQLNAPELFGEVFACADSNKSPVTVVAASDCEVMLIEFKKLVTSCSTSCGFHTDLIRNMLSIMANKNIALNIKLEFMSKRTIREKLSAFLLHEAKAAGSLEFFIGFSRAELSDFLCVDRSALSRELGNMRDEGLIEFDKNRFVILDAPALTC